jgi:2-oxoacid:acceptor oxidoreductase gamma subunit (pyruvate/2-ketoisovalerate family)
MNEIKFYGRGGQGVVTASQMLGYGFFKAGMYPQCYSLFGGERRGAPVVSFLRVDTGKILLKCDIKHPNEMIYIDESLINPEEIRSLLAPGGSILISTSRPIEAFDFLSDFDLALLNAREIAEGLGLGHIINTTILGGYSRFTGRISMDHLNEAIREMVPAKKEANLEAARQGYGKLTLYTAKR